MTVHAVPFPLKRLLISVYVVFCFSDSKPTVPAEVAGYCSSGWSGYGSYCYLPVSGDGEGFTWQEANDQCQILGAELVSIHSKDENEFVELLVETQLTGEDFFWFGLYRNDEGKTCSHFVLRYAELYSHYSKDISQQLQIPQTVVNAVNMRLIISAIRPVTFTRIHNP